MGKMCKACRASIGKMKKTRKTSTNGLLMQTAAIAGGLAAGALVVPQILDKIVGDKAIDPTLQNGAVTGAAIFGAMKTKGMVQDVMIGLAAGSALKLVGQLAGIPGLNGLSDPYHYDSYDLNYVAGQRDSAIPGSGTV